LNPLGSAPDVAADSECTPGAFPIVGVGASAGGLAATTELLQHLGAHSGVGIVAIHHLSPTHTSSLVEILARATPLPVHLATDGICVERNHVYVVPPNADLLLDGPRLRLTARLDGSGLHLPVDRFFESLAQVGERAIGVLLSGSGSDGSAGVRAIKAAGGVIFAQDASAEYRSMPESAVATGCVDLVLSLRSMAAEIVRRGAEPAARWLVDGAGQPDEPAFARMLVLLRRASGIDFTNYKPGTLRRRAERRIFLRRMHSLEEYVALLGRDPAEAEAFCEEVLIHVTSFFRDPAAFDALETAVFPELLRRRAPGAPIRVWVPGCSTGEEVYSLAISLLGFLARANVLDAPIKVFGTDVSGHAIERARTGKYPESIRADITPERLEAYFSLEGSSYQIHRAVRDVCVFARHDATRDPPFSGMDLISCRNLMIYLGAALQARALSIFHYALKEPGFLMLGSSETIHAFPGFANIDAASKIYQRTSAAPHLMFDFAASELSAVPVLRSSEALRASGPLDIHREADRLVLAKFAPPGVVITDEMSVVQFRGRTAPYLAPAPGVPSFELLRMVRDELRIPVRQAIDLVRTKRAPFTAAGLRLAGEELGRVVDIDVLPMSLATSQQRFFVVLFRDVTRPDESRRDMPVDVEPADASMESDAASPLDQLTGELSSTRHYLESVIERLEASNEELRAANEEVTSSNEELRSTNEELQMAKEEIQANNEELHSLNEELGVRNAEATCLSDDLANVLSSVEVPIVLIGRDASVRRFAPAGARVLGLSAESIGRPLVAARRRLADASAEMAREVLELVRPAERTLQDEEGHWYQLTARPYLTRDSRIDGTVLVAFDIDVIKKATERLAAAQRERAARALDRSEREFRDVLGTTAAGIIMVDADDRIVFVNQAVMLLFGYAERDLLGQSVALLVPERLREAHDAWLTGQGSGGAGGEREVTGRRKDGSELALQVTLTPLTRESGLVIVCFVTDLTARRDSEQRIVAYQEKLRQVSFDAALAEERERRRIASDLHDRIGQSLALAKMKLEGMPRSDPERTAIDDAIDLLAQSIVDTRTLIFDLSPPILYELGLEDALSWLAEDLGKRWGIAFELDTDRAAKPLDDATASLVFRAVRELLTNVLKHARVRAATVSLRRLGNEMEIDVKDRGVGFDLEAAQARAGHGGFGLFSVREQISRLGGTVEVESSATMGTRVSLRLPLKLG
jgi:two-component system, chemotaxis family, CheB/CheR fusion protein